MPRLVSIWADPQLTILVLSHLLGNGIKFSPTPSIVTLTATLNQELVRFQVKDRGVGIPAERLEKIFDGFYQVDASDSRPYNGLGLGLALAARIIQLHGGQL
jgi:signal transduction histidine kinase